MSYDGDPRQMRHAAASIEAASNAIHALQTMLNERVNDAVEGWPADLTSDFMRAYLNFDRDVSRIQGSLDEIHDTLTASVAQALRAEVAR